MSWGHLLHAQSLTIEGIVVDAKTQDPLPYASISIQNTYLGTSSNSEGRFAFTVSEEMKDSVLICKYMGYEDFSVRLTSIDSRLTIEMNVDVFTLEEIEVRPWSAWDYVWNAMTKIPDNYHQEAYMATGYYNEQISENDVFLKFTEGIVEMYNPPYGAEQESQSRVMKARRRNDLGSLQFMRDKIDKKYEKEKKKAAKKGEQWDGEDTIDEEIISATFGGPEEVINSDPLRDTASFLQSSKSKKYKYFIDGYSMYQAEKVIVIGFSSKGKYEHQKQNGKIYISLDSDAILSIEYDSKIVIPAIAKPVLFLMGLGIKNPNLQATIHYKSIGDRWFLNSFSFNGGAELVKKKMFKKNQRSTFEIEMALVVNEFDLNSVSEIPEESQIDNEKPLEEQVDPDPVFWENYKAVRPARLSN